MALGLPLGQAVVVEDEAQRRPPLGNPGAPVAKACMSWDCAGECKWARVGRKEAGGGGGGVQCGKGVVS